MAHDVGADPNLTQRGCARAARGAGRLLEAPGRSGALQRRPRFGLHDFMQLERDADRSLSFGLAGAFWQADYGLRMLATPQAFSSLREPGIARLALSFHAETLATGTWLITTTRVACPDAVSLRRLLGHICRRAEAATPA